MTKTYSEDLAAWTKAQSLKTSRHDRYVVAFLSVKCDVQTALEEGYSMKTIWEYLSAKGRLDCRYETFTHHVKRYIQTRQAAQAAPEPQACTPASAAPSREPPRIDRFAFDATPRKEDLL